MSAKVRYAPALPKAVTPGAREFLETTPNRRIDKPIDTARLRQLAEEAVARDVEIERQ